jgi:signal transduction histidine kinase
MNAVKFTEHGQVELVLSAASGVHTLAVCDTGRGIASEHHARVFGVFEQLEQSRQKHTPGVGLGLALVKAMTTALGGSVTLESELGRGSVFTVRLPTSGPARAALRAARPG